jgi:hypothetical protein
MTRLHTRLAVVAVLLFCMFTAVGNPTLRSARAQADAGFVTLKDFPAAVTAIGHLGGATPTTVVATQNAGIYSMSGTSKVFRKLPGSLFWSPNAGSSEPTAMAYGWCRGAERHSTA